jgi:hypothetical protein
MSKASSTPFHEQIMDFAPRVEGDLPQRLIRPQPTFRLVVPAGVFFRSA